MLNFNEEMKKLKTVKGYLGAALLNSEGETLYLDDGATNSDIAYSASIFNDAFLEIGESAIDIGFTTTNMLEARTVEGHIFLIKSIEDKKSATKLTVFTIFENAGNVPLAKMVIDRSAEKILKVLNDL